MRVAARVRRKLLILLVVIVVDAEQQNVDAIFVKVSLRRLDEIRRNHVLGRTLLHDRLHGDHARQDAGTESEGEQQTGQHAPHDALGFALGSEMLAHYASTADSRNIP